MQKFLGTVTKASKSAKQTSRCSDEGSSCPHSIGSALDGHSPFLSLPLAAFLSQRFFHRVCVCNITSCLIHSNRCKLPETLHTVFRWLLRKLSGPAAPLVLHQLSHVSEGEEELISGGTYSLSRLLKCLARRTSPLRQKCSFVVRFMNIDENMWFCSIPASSCIPIYVQPCLPIFAIVKAFSYH